MRGQDVNHDTGFSAGGVSSPEQFDAGIVRRRTQVNSRPADGPLFLPLLAVPPALAGIGAATPRRPLAYGAAMLLAAIAAAPFTTMPEVPWSPRCPSWW